MDLYAERCGNDTKAVADCEKKACLCKANTKWEKYGQMKKNSIAV